MKKVMIHFFVSPFSRRVLFTVAAAIRLASSSDAPRSSSDSLMCSYWRFLLGFSTPLGGKPSPSKIRLKNGAIKYVGKEIGVISLKPFCSLHTAAQFHVHPHAIALSLLF